MDGDFLAALVLCPEGLALTSGVVLDNLVRRVEDGFCAAVILFKTDYLCVFEALLERENILNRSSTEFIDTLVVVSDYADILRLFSEHRNKLVLHLVGILVLVNHNVFKKVLIVFQHIGAGLEQLDGIAEHIVKIHSVGVFKL